LKVQCAGLLIGACFGSTLCCAQGLAPRAYVITPTGSNAITLTYPFSAGDVQFDSAIPITDFTAQIGVPVLSYYRGFGLIGHSASITAWLPYGVGNFSGKVLGKEQSVYRSGLTDSSYRFSANLVGGPAMPINEFRHWRQTTVVGASLTVVAPTGQYDPARLINHGSNRWAFKPEIGLSQRRGRWILDAYGGIWFFTANRHFFTGNQTQTQLPVAAMEMHLSYDVKPRLWFSVDGNFWYGGATSLNGIERANTIQKASRAGATASIPLNKHHSLKFSYSAGVYIRLVGDYQHVAAAWQYSWVREPK
jgi:Putative MetA-pathway of phenol degradation